MTRKDKNNNDNKNIDKDININNTDNETRIIYRKKKIPAALRIAVWNTYIGAENLKEKCLCCSEVDITIISFACGHIIAESKGGLSTIDNLRPICNHCNLSMGTQNMEDFIMDQGFKRNANWNGYNNKIQKCNELIDIIINMINIIDNYRDIIIKIANLIKNESMKSKIINSDLNADQRVHLIYLVNLIISPNKKKMDEIIACSLGLKYTNDETENMEKNE